MLRNTFVKVVVELWGCHPRVGEVFSLPPLPIASSRQEGYPHSARLTWCLFFLSLRKCGFTVQWTAIVGSHVPVFSCS